jgi:hypothetical protein
VPDSQKDVMTGSIMKQLLTALAIGVIGCLPAVAQGQGEASATAVGYLDPQCPRPEVELIKPAYAHVGNIEDSGPTGSYNAKVKVYNREAQDYDSCMHAYIDGANAELKRVQDDANQRIRQISESANTRLKLIEAKVAAAVEDANQVSQDEAAKHK